MNTDKILKVLEDKYRLRPNQLSVLRALMGGEKHTYLQLSREANVPKTKIYELVNELRQIGLVNFLQEAKGPTLYHMADVRKNLLEFLNRQMEGSIEKYEAAVNILEEEEQLEERSLLQSPNQYVFGVIRILVESEAVYAVSRRRSAPPVFYPQKREDYHKLRNAVARSRETLTGTKELTRIMFEEIIKAIEKGRHFTYIMTYNGLLFFFEKYKECFGSEMAIEYIKALPTLLEQSRHKVFVIEETNPLTMYASEKQIALVITESRGEIAGIQTNKKEIVDSYLQLFREMLSRSKPIQHYLDRIVI